MRLVITITSLLLVATAVTGLPKTCRGGTCHDQRASVSNATPREAPSSATPLNSPPLTPSVKEGLTVPEEDEEPLTVPEEDEEPLTEETTTDAVTEETATEAVTEEVRRVGVNGWLAAPTQAPAKTESRTPVPNKSGRCESPKGYGIKCLSRMDQCEHDGHCPNSTKCCLVGECGQLCVKPKPTSTTAKEPVKEGAKTEAKKDKDAAKEEVQEASQQEELPSPSQDAAEGTTHEGESSVQEAEGGVDADAENNRKQEPQQAEENVPTTVEVEASTEAFTEEATDA